jgi:hypothetical protein
LRHPNWIVLGLALVVLATLVAWELHAPSPLVNLRLLAGNHGLRRT